MRREGFEISVGKTKVILHKQDGVTMEPFETLVVEEALEYIEDDELVEVTPTVVRLRKILLSENERKKVSRQKAMVG